MRNWITILKGVAITAVVLLHVLSSLPYGTFTIDSWHNFYIILDQSLRFCVPLFVALSGFTLAKKYQSSELTVGTFYRRRLFKLLPLYVFWSLVFYVVFAMVDGWRNHGQSTFIPHLLFWGRADYHLYFVPMIFQLYLLFPLLQRLMSSRWRHLTLVGTLVIQSVVLLAIDYYMDKALGMNQRPWLAVDQHQYLLSLSWIGYFGLGMWLSFIQPKKVWFTWLKRVAAAAVVGGWIWIITFAMRSIAGGQDPLYELRFTRFGIMVYALALSYIVIVHQRVVRFVPQAVQKVLTIIGKHSYLIYLSHTLFLRIIFARPFLADGRVSWVEVVGTALLGLLAVFVSLRVKWD